MICFRKQKSSFLFIFSLILSKKIQYKSRFNLIVLLLEVIKACWLRKPPFQSKRINKKLTYHNSKQIFKN